MCTSEPGRAAGSQHPQGHQQGPVALSQPKARSSPRTGEGALGPTPDRPHAGSGPQHVRPAQPPLSVSETVDIGEEKPNSDHYTFHHDALRFRTPVNYLWLPQTPQLQRAAHQGRGLRSRALHPRTFCSVWAAGGTGPGAPAPLTAQPSSRAAPLTGDTGSKQPTHLTPHPSPWASHSCSGPIGVQYPKSKDVNLCN